ncbi:outer membrane protein [Flavobacterium sp. 7E]|uniref:outer membrane beta-barrel protein n=1 Tax=Flavobacterium sp. 7E TaxID=2735898 RepID=UPI00156F5301|nr:outer membrane beta-barrel protein [Flavobacterium sp. 7E]NRS89302.1 outer membrane protein [Flavobacterium sp. 7E]
MKKIILTVAAVFAFGFANAQSGDQSGESLGFSKEDIFVEGNLGFSSSNDKNTETKVNNFSFTPKVGYFLADNFVLGVQLGLGSDKTKVSGTDAGKNSNFNAGVFGRYYFLELGKRFKTYADAEVNFANSKYELGPIENKSNGVSAGAGLGINYFVTKCVVLNFSLRNILSYSSSKPDVAGAKSTSQFGFDLNGNVANPFATGSFGVGYIF